MKHQLLALTYSCSSYCHIGCFALTCLSTNANFSLPTVCSRHPEIQDAVAALARHVCLKAQDKADSRTAAVKACAELVTDLPQGEQEQFVGFVYNLSRSKQVCAYWCRLQGDKYMGG